MTEDRIITYFVIALSNIFSPCLNEGQHLNKHDLYNENSPDDRNFYFSCKHIGQSRLSMQRGYTGGLRRVCLVSLKGLSV